MFDPATRAFTDRTAAPEGGPVDNGLQLGPDGMIYGLTHTLIYRLDPGSVTFDVIVEFDERLTGHAAAGPIVGRDLYFSSGHRLMAAEIL